jgi:hypothetical protein
MISTFSQWVLWLGSIQNIWEKRFFLFIDEACKIGCKLKQVDDAFWCKNSITRETHEIWKIELHNVYESNMQINITFQASMQSIVTMVFFLQTLKLSPHNENPNENDSHQNKKHRMCYEGLHTKKSSQSEKKHPMVLTTSTRKNKGCVTLWPCHLHWNIC